MKFLASAFIVALLSYSFGLFLPWWSIAIAGFITGILIPQKRALSLLACFIGVFLFWGMYAFFISQANDHNLAHRVSLLILKKDNPILLIIATGFIGGITAGISAFTGRSLVIVLRKTS